MSTVFLLSIKKDKISKIADLSKKSGMQMFVFDAQKDLQEELKKIKPDILLLDNDYEDAAPACRVIRGFLAKENIPVILILKEKANAELLKISNAYLHDDFEDSVFIAAMHSCLKVKKSLDTLSGSNQELQKNIYQLDALYSTSSQLAGSLDKVNLINIMIDGLEKSLSYSLSYAFLINSDKNIEIIINSLYPLSERFEKAIKLRAVLSYKSLFEKKKLPYEINMEDVKVFKYIKHRFGEYDLNVFKYDNLFSPIKIGENFFGFIEVFKEIDFTQEDATCFQTLTKQVSIPLESALLYEEIKNTNVKLEKLERLKSEFISIVSHELRTPLTAIKNSLEIMLSGKSGELTDGMQKFLNLARRNVLRLSAIINDLLDLSKIEAGKMDFRFEQINLNQPAEFVKNTFESLAKEKNISLKLDICGDLEFVYADIQKIEQILSNLVSNAVKFTNEGGEIVIKTEKINAAQIDLSRVQNNYRQKPQGDYILLSVKDNGIGISPEDKYKVFDEFKQIENSNTRKVGGTGLGLPIAKQLTEAHLGYIWFDSEAGLGSTFYLAVPAKTEEKTFYLDLTQEIQKAKYTKSSVSFLSLEEKTSCGFSLIDMLKSDRSLITKSERIRYFSTQSPCEKTLTIYVPDADKFAAEFMHKRLQGILLQNGVNTQKCDILFSKVIYPDDEIDIDKIFKKLNESLKKII